jgi:hypothetical protein
VPSDAAPLVATAIGVMGVSFGGLALAWIRLRSERTDR